MQFHRRRFHETQIFKERRVLWADLMVKNGRFVGEKWCIEGDFNTVLEKGERISKGRGGIYKGSEEFVEFVEVIELVDLPSVGGKFTWYNGRWDLCLYEKLKRLKTKLRVWNIKVFGWIDLKVEDKIDDLNELDQYLINNLGGANVEEVESRRVVSEEIRRLIVMKEDMLRLKSRVNCCMVEGVKEVKLEIKRHFEKFFKESSNMRPTPEGLPFSKLEEVVRIKLEEPFMEEEEDVMRFIRDFHEKARLTKACTSSFITLIPKVPNPQFLSEYRPICLVGSLYKILSKLLAMRLKSVIGNLFFIKQSTFIKCRNILDGILTVNKILDLAKREKRSCLVSKVDYDKAYDSVSWNYLRFMLIRTGFGSKWLDWMEACVFLSSMEVEKAVDLGEFKGFSFGVGESVDILQFTDDTVIIGDGSNDNLWSLKTVLRAFEIMSGLKVNFYKSNIYGVNLSDRMLNMESFLACGVRYLPFKILGVMVADSPRKEVMWKEVINIMRNRLSIWSSRFLSIGGKVVLINSMFNSLPLYSLSFYRAPKSHSRDKKNPRKVTLEGVEGSRGIQWLSWSKVCKEKNQGGLGIRDVESFNTTLLMKWKWRIIKEDIAVWRKLLIYRYVNPTTKMFVNDKRVISTNTIQFGGMIYYW
ncbi:uncharacterized protein LOC131629831 [Vicia villosa]|uniref:uncharacterized protein LOC131629831 n=1 Tax=Vicia villosa TaxID=3911 RepID=UPI00273B0846|nr:uncharacterized protein LOC131629831 [Vicia villosa]